MATTPRSRAIDYPTGDGKPMAETDYHRDLMMALILTLEAHYQHDSDVYVSGNLLLFYEEGNRRKHVSPDVFVVRGIPKQKRDNYLTWEEGKGPDLVIELTSKSTRSEDVRKKKALYRDVLGVPEYFLFDPLQEYLDPPMQGYRLVEGQYRPIQPVDGRLPSEVLGLHLERDGMALRLRDPATGLRLPTSVERAEQAEAVALADRLRAEQAEAVALAERVRAEQAEAVALADRLRAEQAEAELDRLRREMQALRGRGAGGD